MKTKLERIIEQLKDLHNRANDDELADELDNALIHLDAASEACAPPSGGRLIAMEEEEDELDPIEREAAIALADDLLDALDAD
jgi:hypothetical protein